MAFPWFTIWKKDKEPAPNLSHLKFVLFTRMNCHLCDDAHQVLVKFQNDYGFPLECVDVDSEPCLREQYGLTVPVVAVNGKERFRGQVNVVLLRRFLIAEARNQE
jgi:thiol-disulfide isomerase/thioredoxin